MTRSRVAGLCALMLATLPALSVSADLTVNGAEKGANKDGTIPAWGGAEGTPAGWRAGEPRAGFAKYRGEKPLFTIDGGSADKYADKLSPGQMRLLKKTPGYKMEVYPSHRNCANPAFVDENTAKNLTQAKLSADGQSLAQANLPGVPFPQPKTGMEAMWNFLMHYQGVGVYWPRLMTYLSPRTAGSEALVTNGPQRYFYPWGAKGTTSPDKVGQVMLAFAFDYEEPTALAGQALVQKFYFNKPSETFFYFPGQRRVRRMPTYSYDAPIVGYENQYLVDQTFLFYGNPDRYDWKLVGKKEMYVPYNSFGMYDSTANLSNVLQPKGINPAARRYELHRVWVVEGKVREGMRHTSPVRTLYLDEDSWIAVVGEDHDAQGDIWKVKEGFPIPAWELGGACQMTSFVQYDMATGRYLVDGTPLGTGKEMLWYAEPKDASFTPAYYTDQQLQARSER